MKMLNELCTCEKVVTSIVFTLPFLVEDLKGTIQTPRGNFASD